MDLYISEFCHKIYRVRKTSFIVSFLYCVQKPLMKQYQMACKIPGIQPSTQRTTFRTMCNLKLGPPWRATAAGWREIIEKLEFDNPNILLVRRSRRQAQWDFARKNRRCCEHVGVSLVQHALGLRPVQELELREECRSSLVILTEIFGYSFIRFFQIFYIDKIYI
jgi:hypothetical protein